MKWYDIIDDDNPYHQLYVLLNDKTDILIRIETRDLYNFDAWVMDMDDPTLLRRIGIMPYSLKQVKIYCEAVLLGVIPQDHDALSEPRPLKAGLPD
jgi:hypothetical protein